MTLKIKLAVMRNFCTAIILGILLGCGCSDSLEPQGCPISLSASLGGIVSVSGQQTKAETPSDNVSAVPFTGAPSDDNRLDAALWFSYTPGSYSHNPVAPTYLPCKTTAAYTGLSPMDIRTGNNILQYPISDQGESADEVYCVGFHPGTGWGNENAAAATSASHTINGNEDLLFAEQIKGSYSNNFGQQKFSHLLTWVKINFSATSFTAAGIWGEIESLKIISPDNTVEIGFSQEYGKNSTISYSGESVTFPLTLPENRTLNVTNRTYGQAFCAPPARAKKDDAGYVYDNSLAAGQYGYIVKVKTKNIGKEKEVFVPLKKMDGTTDIANTDAIGKLFVINLYFNDVALVEGVCTLKHWEDLSSDIYLE